jgi:hypothetical protein
MATRSGKNTGIQASGRKHAAKGGNRGGVAKKGVAVNKMDVETVRESATRKKKKKTAPTTYDDDDDDESELDDGYASENEIQNTVTQNAEDEEDNNDEEGNDEESIGNVPSLLYSNDNYRANFVDCLCSP